MGWIKKGSYGIKEEPCKDCIFVMREAQSNQAEIASQTETFQNKRGKQRGSSLNKAVIFQINSQTYKTCSKFLRVDQSSHQNHRGQYEQKEIICCNR